MTRGIYTITNTKTGKIYVGQSSNIENRWSMHKNQLNGRSHSNYKLLKDWCKYGPDTFVFEVVEEVFVEDINEKEEFWIDSFEGYVYNLVRGEHPTKKVPTLVDGIHEFDSLGSAATWYGISTWCVRNGVRKRQEVDCGHSKHMFQRQDDQPDTLWEYHGFEVYSFEDIGDAVEPSYDPERNYIREELLEKTWESAKECLTEEEYDLFHTHFELGLDQKSLGTMRGVSHQSVSLKLLKINEKVRKHVVNKKWEL